MLILPLGPPKLPQPPENVKPRRRWDESRILNTVDESFWATPFNENSEIKNMSTTRLSSWRFE